MPKVQMGLEQCYVAFHDGAGGFEAPERIPGAVSFTPTPQGSETPYYADNGVYYVSRVNRGYTAEMTFFDVPQDMLARMLGWEIDDNGMLVEVANAVPVKFALLGQVETDIHARRFVYYDCEASRPATQHQTKGEEGEPQPTVLPLTIRPFTYGGKVIVRGVIEPNETNEAVYSAWFDAVTLPDATPGSVEKAKLDATIAIADKLDEADWSPGTWAALQTALIAAESVSADTSATQQAVNAADKALRAAILALVPAA
jgi:phi13 family phage major tail protein